LKRKNLTIGGESKDSWGLQGEAATRKEGKGNPSTIGKSPPSPEEKRRTALGLKKGNEFSHSSQVKMRRKGKCDYSSLRGKKGTNVGAENF